MELDKLKIPDLIVLKPKKFKDERGYFQETYNKKQFNKFVGRKVNFVQDNFSVSKKGVLRGIHFQKKPFEQGKLVRVSMGRVIDIAVDLRENSETYLQWDKIELSEENGYQLWIPEGFGHAFFTLSDIAHFCYKTTNFYNPASEDCIIWNDPKIGIIFDTENIPIKISPKDKLGRML